jgi:membrane protein DedA with SNARE-associated domain
VWASIWVLLGWIVGEHWEWAAKSVGGWTAGIGIVVVLALALPVALRLYRRGRRGCSPRHVPTLGEAPRHSRDAR